MQIDACYYFTSCPLSNYDCRHIDGELDPGLHEVRKGPPLQHQMLSHEEWCDTLSFKVAFQRSTVDGNPGPQS